MFLIFKNSRYVNNLISNIETLANILCNYSVQYVNFKLPNKYDHYESLFSEKTVSEMFNYAIKNTSLSFLKKIKIKKKHRFMRKMGGLGKTSTILGMPIENYQISRSGEIYCGLNPNMHVNHDLCVKIDFQGVLNFQNKNGGNVQNIIIPKEFFVSRAEYYENNPLANIGFNTDIKPHSEISNTVKENSQELSPAERYRILADLVDRNILE